MAAKKPTGRPRRWRPEYIKQAEKLAMLGYTDEKLADFFGVSLATFYRWKADRPEFKAAVADAKEIKDAEVVSALFKRAVGTTRRVEKAINTPNGIEIVEVVEEVPADVPAAKFWLCNRQRDKYSAAPELDQGGAVIPNVVINVPRPPDDAD